MDGKVKDCNERIIGAAGYETIFVKLRKQLAAASVHSTVEKIMQVFTDASGNPIQLTVTEFNDAINRSISIFMDDPEWPFNVARHFVDKLEPTIKAEFEKDHREYLTQNDLRRDVQLGLLSQYYEWAVEAEKEVNTTKKLVQKTISDHTHNFIAQMIKEDAQGFISAAEKTLKEHGKDEAPTPNCWGCGGPHSYRKKGTTDIICPNKDKPGVADRADARYKAWLNKRKARSAGWVQKKNVKFSQLSEKEKEVGRQHLLKEATELASVASNASKSTTSNATTCSTVTTSTADAALSPALVYITDMTVKPLLPIMIDNEMPHINVLLGDYSMSLERSPMISAMVDSCAGLSTGWIGFWAPILKTHPKIIEGIIGPPRRESTLQSSWLVLLQALMVIWTGSAPNLPWW